ncbi:Translation elongation factor Ts [Labilithrix luteola]|uniref:Elongation factor Ts n=1 Tax=Labilithrix luteola TaxID=1391654 RepID=A0A0K1Q8X9_9BACT|nr:translation elongation factor Ts [Labilithrix luteola]AKV02194.1 Translation elongation factor Ts [Labilithrix luteola]
MAAVTPALIKELRERTSAGMSDCKNALVEAEGDLEKAVEVILKKGIVKAASRAGKVAAEGEVATWVSADGKKGVIVEVNCQTDFVARGDDFKTFVRNVVSVAQNLAKGGDLASQTYPGTEKSIDLVRQELVGRIGENIVVRRWDSLEASGPNGVIKDYVHMGGKLAVLLSADAPTADLANAEFLGFVENAAMQVAAMSPLVVDKSQLAQADVDKQREIYVAQMKEEVDAANARIAELKAATDLSPEELAKELKAAESRKGPPEAMWPKVIEGKITKWYTETTLLGQDNVWEPGGGSVDKLRSALGKKLGGELKLNTFVRFGLGEGIEKKTEDLAAEVAKTIGN